MPETRRSLKDICDVINAARDGDTLSNDLETVDCRGLTEHDVRALIFEAFDAGHKVGFKAGVDWGARNGW